MFSNLPAKEQLPLKLRAVYELYGYKKYNMDKFEPYDMYLENKSFLKYEGIITFTNTNGRLMALKPDVTMSIVKNTSDSSESNKLYYNENVFRRQQAGGEFCEINQMGLEFIGGDDNYSEAEVTLLALRSLEAIDNEYVLNIAHMGYISSLLDYCGVENRNREKCLRLIKQKNTHGINDFASELKLENTAKDTLKAVITISGGLYSCIEKLSAFALNKGMTEAIDEMKGLYNAVKEAGLESKLQLDFSVVNDPDYYNGIVFQGFIPSTPRAVLSGGRYDNLMRRFGKEQNAIGFALYLGELDRVFRKTDEYDTDLLLLYGNAGADRVVKEVERLKNSYESIRAEKTLPVGIRARNIINISESEVN
ncbi:MAG: ATP phosphoribosyltransferase regulatory subunit [Eubacteriales bacterium]|nr:ATP phosphoribosyltransferase regulatory subunit [Eubacteriales bacterium]MDD4422282.1 ATP phosphoribosyltransferase regulatory subunit [Eubacteriales bacterium]